jgi:hypothetical protein
MQQRHVPATITPQGSLATTTLADAREFLVELVSQLFHADVLIAEQAERIDALEGELARLRAALDNATGAAA